MDNTNAAVGFVYLVFCLVVLLGTILFIYRRWEDRDNRRKRQVQRIISPSSVIHYLKKDRAVIKDVRRFDFYRIRYVDGSVFSMDLVCSRNFSDSRIIVGGMMGDQFTVYFINPRGEFRFCSKDPFDLIHFDTGGEGEK